MLFPGSLLTPAAAAGTGSVTDVTATGPLASSGGDTPDISIADSATAPTTQTDVTASRALGTIYQNTTGKLLFVGVSGSNVAGTTPAGLKAVTDANASPSVIVAQNTCIAGTSAAKAGIFFMVLPNNFYRVTFDGIGTTLASWVEWN